ncbi:hypothetical protein TraAM80_01775 [Trypanosoma rangeli]|uniref:Uncharacterized protein n=1 Tax=Trypanosoma rangeli TaxID=5698 RepID=A0A3R7MYK8_TRYRA|nr:uncharacterized protein TraAM80_01775 [Trypanosoma rangeli]RNF10039.1 hypothetical protein TraAM80_01775 [Trypanosoma rangeli]|eukprot:RNF10039.1 hypothetical protein TraAM80_01775 [Trypanosoma rangeli]
MPLSAGKKPGSSVFVALHGVSDGATPDLLRHYSQTQSNISLVNAGDDVLLTPTLKNCSTLPIFGASATPISAPQPTPSGAGGEKKANRLLTVRSRHAKVSKKNALIAATNSAVEGRRAAIWVEQWDRGSRTTRLLILEAFLLLHSSSNTIRMEKDLGDSSMLFFTRITAWLRLTCRLNHPLRLLLAATSLFVRGVRYLTCLVEVGGAEMLIDTLATCSLVAEDRREIVLLLLYMANAGRVYREMLCDDDEIDLLLQAMRRESEDDILDLFVSLMLLLGEGNNPRVTSRVQSGMVRMITQNNTTTAVILQAARILRIFQSSRDKMYADTIARDALEDTGTVPVVGVELNASPDSARQLLEALFFLLFHDELSLRVEGSELLTMVAKNIQLTGPILTRCFDVVDEDRLAIEAEENLSVAMTFRRHQMSFGSTAVNIILLDTACEARQRLMLDIILRRSAHFTLLKYLQLLESEYAASILDCCRALQLICRAGLLQERKGVVDSAEAEVTLAKAANHIRVVVGDTLYGVLLYEDLTEDEALSIARAVTSSEQAM